MKPRLTLLITIGILAYISLSLYHWRQVKNLPGGDQKNGVHSVLSREKHENNWVQVTTSPAQMVDSPETKPVTHATEELRTSVSQTKNSPPESPSPLMDATPPDSVEKPHAIDDDISALQKSLQKEKESNLQHIKNIDDLRTRIISLQTALDETSAHLQEKSLTLEELKKQSSQTVATPASENSGLELSTLRNALAARIESLDKANNRIKGLGVRLDQSRSSLAEMEHANRTLQNNLSKTETAKTKARQEVDRLREELIQTNEEREKYLAETGRLHTELKQVKNHLARTENELKKVRLTSEAMLRYGKEQSELINPFRQQIEMLNARVEDKNSELITALGDIEQFKGQQQLLQDKTLSLQLAQAKSKVIEQELQATSQQVSDSLKHSKKLTEQLKVLADQLNRRDETINNLKQQVDLAQTYARDAAQKTDALTQEKEQQELELTKLSQKILQQKEQLDAAILSQQTIEEELATALKVTEQLHEQLAEKEKMLDEAQAQTAQLASRLDEEEKLLTEADTANRDNTVQQLQEALESAQNQLSETRVETEELKNSLSQAQLKLADNTTINKLQQEIEQLKAIIDSRTKQQKKQEQTIAALKLTNSDFEEKIKIAKKENTKIAEITSALDQANREKEEQGNRIVMLVDKNDKLQAELGQRETAFFAMQEEYSSLQDRHKTLLKERNELVLYTLDSDNDSVSDAEDTCPATQTGAEVDENGCECDSDDDGLVDRLDLCPDEPAQPETNMFGCSPGEPIVLQGLFFSGGNAELSPASQQYLDGVAAILDLSGDVQVEIGGHTDSIGEMERNLTVSKQRAKAVTDYLINKGIPTGRLIPVGYGPELPVADNSTREGRAANRRVELKIIQSQDSPAVGNDTNIIANEEEQDLPTRSKIQETHRKD